MSHASLPSTLGTVALLTEGVDRNMVLTIRSLLFIIVALLTEGVDRNSLSVGQFTELDCRPPHGGRG